MRSFSVAMMHIFCQSLIGCSRSVDRAAHGPQTRQMAGFDRSQFENYVRRCRLLAASVLLPFVTADFFLTQPRSKVCRSVASIFFFRPRVVERESKMCSLFCARGLRASDAIPESLHLTPSLPLLVFNMPRLLHSQVYLTIMWRRSLQFATKKDLKKFRFAPRHSTHKVCTRARTLALNFFYRLSFWNCVHCLIRNLSHADNLAISQTLQVSNFRYLPRSAEENFRFNGLSSLLIENNNNFKYRVTRNLLFFHCKLLGYICFKSWKSIVISLIVGKVKEPGIRRNKYELNKTFA